MAVPNDSDLFAMYFKLRERTEPPVIYHRWSWITCLSAYLGRQCWLPFGANRIFPNCYTMLIGHPGARKSTAIRLAKQIFSEAGYNTFAAEKTSKEKFLLDLEGLSEEDLAFMYKNRISKSVKNGGGSKGITADELTEALFGKDDEEESKKIKDPREVFIVADEFNEFVGSGNIEFLSLLGALYDWDDAKRDYSYRLKNSKSVSIYQPTISILSGNTHDGFNEAFPPQSIGQGFLSRLILVYGEPSGKKIAFPPVPDGALQQRIIERLQEIKKTIVGPFELPEDSEAYSALEMIYNSWQQLEDGRFKHYSNRRHTHHLKLAMLCAAMRCSREIELQDVILSNTILIFTENDMPKALGEFGKSKDSSISGKIMAALYETKQPMTPSELLKIVRNDVDKNTQIGEIMTKLINAGQVQFIAGKGYLPKTRILNARQMYVNFDLLKEYTIKFGPALKVVK